VAVVFDTNVLVSAVLRAASNSSLAVRRAAVGDTVLASVATLSELAVTMERRKFDRYVSIESRREFVTYVHMTVKVVKIERSVHICSDPADDKFLEVALNARVDVLVTGDKDLLVLGVFEGTTIVPPERYHSMVGR
jgi:uncharacterized protein